jgi:hypothetical protein
MPGRTQGTVRASKANAAFRMVLGLVLLGIGVNQYEKGGAYVQAAMVSFVLGGLFLAYGLFAFFFSRKIGSKFEFETATPAERLAELTQMKASGLITAEEYEAKRQEILKDL